MEDLISLQTALAGLIDRLALGAEMFGRHAVWIWLLPPIWMFAALMIWARMEDEEEKLDRLYITRAERNLPRLKELIKQRSTEVLEVRAIDQRPKR